MKILVSGIQTSGNLHLGNYLGSIKNWVDLHINYQSFLFLADLHSITVPQDPKKLLNSTLEVAAAYIASGIDVQKANIFVQSSVPAHTELAWILSCMTSMGWMNRMTQFKDKAGKNKEKASLGLYSYPVLQAADILIYKSDIVPVGEDQKQHLELCRDIALSFNRYINQDFFNLPEPIIMDKGSRIMSLKEGLNKMSKSDPSDLSRINLLDDKDIIIKKIKKAKTDLIPEIYYDKVNRPEISNLLTIYSLLSDSNIENLTEKYHNKGFAIFKNDLAELIIEKILPISNEMKRLIKDDISYIRQILQNGKEKANETANRNIEEIKKLLGFLS